MTLKIVKPSLDYLPGYQAALERGWVPMNTNDENARARKKHEDLSHIARNPSGFTATFDYPGPINEPVSLPDGSTVPRLPGFGRWLWDGEFCGHIGFRWQKGTTQLPPTCMGHIGYSVVSWKQNRGYATEALRLLLADIKGWLPYVDITTDPDNMPSQRVIEANQGYFVENFTKPKMFGGTEGRLYRIDLAPSLSPTLTPSTNDR